jgi:hypothetical protein
MGGRVFGPDPFFYSEANVMRKWIGLALIVAAIAVVQLIDLRGGDDRPSPRPEVSRFPFPFPRATQFPRSNGLIDVRAVYELAVTYCASTPVQEVAKEFQTEPTENAAAEGYAAFKDPEEDGILYRAALRGVRTGSDWPRE